MTADETLLLPLTKQEAATLSLAVAMYLFALAEAPPNNPVAENLRSVQQKLNTVKA